MKKFALIGIILFFSIPFMAQRTLPADALKAIPAKYKIINQIFVKQGFMARAEVNLTIPNKNGCNDGNLGECNIKITITQYDETQKEYLAMVEKRLPFQNRLPGASNYKPSVDPNNTLVSYSPSKEVKLEGGSAAYYIQKNTCIIDQHSEYESIALKSLQGNTAKAVEIMINGGISPEDAISIVKELYTYLSKVDYLAP